MYVRLNIGPITDPKSTLVDDSLTLGQAIAKYNLTGEVSLNGASLSNTDRNKTLAELGVSTDDYLCSARKNGGN